MLCHAHAHSSFCFLFYNSQMITWKTRTLATSFEAFYMDFLIHFTLIILEMSQFFNDSVGDKGYLGGVTSILINFLCSVLPATLRAPLLMIRAKFLPRTVRKLNILTLLK